MICWYCHWGWPRQTAEIYKRAAKDLGSDVALFCGPGSAVFGHNFGEDHIRSAIKQCDEQRQAWSDRTDAEIARVRQALCEFLEIPEATRCCQPADYDGKHPENYPPPLGLEMIDIAADGFVW